MNNNHVFRRIVDVFEFDHESLMTIVHEAGFEVAEKQFERWLVSKDKENHELLGDHDLSQFLDALIDFRRGKKNDAKPRPPEAINNNVVFRKLKIALDMQAGIILQVLESSDIVLSKHELSALFRKAGHKHYRDCSDAVLNGFFDGLEYLDLNLYE